MKLSKSDKVKMSFEVGESLHMNIKPVFFELTEDAESLSIKFSYTDKNEISDEKITSVLSKDLAHLPEEAYSKIEQAYLDRHLLLENLITLGLEGPDGFIGNAHRKNRVQNILINETNSSHGFINTKCKKGTWKINILGFAVYNDILMDLEIEAR